MALDIRGYTVEYLLGLLTKNDETSCKELEKIGSLLTAENIMELLERQKKIPPRNLSSLFRNLSEETFAGIIKELSDHQLNLLLTCVHEEPLLHQLTIFAHGCEKSLAEINQQIVLCLGNIERLEDASFPGIESQYECIAELEQRTAYITAALQNALRLAWQSDRQQLVATLSPLKESAEKLQQLVIGKKKNGPAQSTGLYLKLEEQLSAIYDKSLKDTDPSIEALAVLGLVYLEDFKAVGLVKSDISKDTLKHVQHTLDQLGLRTIADVKANHIFSRLALQEYIKHAYKLMRL